MKTSAWIYPWDIADHGPSTLAPLIGGLDSVNVAVSYHSLFAAVPDNPRRHLIELNRGAVYFTPDESHWRESVVRPRISPMLGEIGDALALGRSLADAAGTDFTAWTVTLHNSLGNRHPELGIRTVWGDIVTAAQCVRNPLVRAYTHALVANVAAHADRVQLESAHWMPLPHHPHVKLAVPHPINLGLIAQLCFCDHCRTAGRAAGIDVAALAERLRDRWQECYLPPVLSPLSSVDGLPEYQAVRAEAVTSLTAELVSRSPVPIEFVSFGDRAATGVNLAAIERAGAPVRILAYGPADRVRTVRDLEETAADRPASLNLGLSLLPEHILDQGAFRAAVIEAQGTDSVSFYHLGLVTADRREWLKELPHG